MSTYNHIAGQRSGRVEALSDGVFSIAMTLLVFNLKVPAEGLVVTDVALWDALRQIVPDLLAFLLSFMTLGIFWIGHSTQFVFIQRTDRNLTWISVFFLMFITLLPFTTRILSSHITNRISIGLYWVNIASLGFLLWLHWVYANKRHLVQTDDANVQSAGKLIMRRIYTAQALYAMGAMLSLVNTWLSLLVIIGIQLNYALGLINFRRYAVQ
ncbi:MAG: TMEM175 family protein [Bacteroidia bacterium]|nr:TMEM175 family protein [Bacteroidia bacterium]